MRLVLTPASPLTRSHVPPLISPSLFPRESLLPTQLAPTSTPKGSNLTRLDSTRLESSSHPTGPDAHIARRGPHGSAPRASPRDKTRPRRPWRSRGRYAHASTYPELVPSRRVLEPLPALTSP